MSFLPEFSPIPRMSPAPLSAELMMGAASPLWGYFSGFAAAGVAWWWMTRLTPQNLEALMARAAAGPDTLPAVGGEAAPISPLVELAREAAPEPVSPPPGPVAPTEPLAARVRRTAPPGPATEA